VGGAAVERSGCVAVRNPFVWDPVEREWYAVPQMVIDIYNASPLMRRMLSEEGDPVASGSDLGVGLAVSFVAPVSRVIPIWEESPSAQRWQNLGIHLRMRGRAQPVDWVKRMP
jgi:hypothetical protein